MFQSQIIQGAYASEQRNQAVLESMGILHKGPIQYMVFKTQFENKEYYCCCSGGELIGSNVYFTPIGEGAAEALALLDVEGNDKDNIHVYSLQCQDDKSLQEQVKELLSPLPDRSRVCFVGDILGVLKGKIEQAFNVIS